MESKLDRLFALLGSGSSQVAQKAAAQQIGAIVKAHPHDLYVLLEKANTYLQNKDWETRTAAGLTIEAAVENVGLWEPSPTEEPTSVPGSEQARLTFAILDLPTVVEHGDRLVASGGQEYDIELDNLPIEAKLAKQRKIMNEKLGLFNNFSGLVLDDQDFLMTHTEKQAPAPVVDELAGEIAELKRKIADPKESSRLKNQYKRKLQELEKQAQSRKISVSLTGNSRPKKDQTSCDRAT